MQINPDKRLTDLAYQLKCSIEDTAALLLEEGLRMTEHPRIAFRTSIVGRLAYVQGSNLAVWEVAMIADDFERDAVQVAAHLEWPLAWVNAALLYADIYPEEIKDIQRGPLYYPIT